MRFFTMKKEFKECFDFIKEQVRRPDESQSNQVLARLTAIEEHINLIAPVRWDVFGIGEYVDKQSRERKKQ